MKKKDKKRLIQLVIAGLIIISEYITTECWSDSFHSPVKIESDDIETYSGKSYVVINDNEPCFTRDDLTMKPFERYSELDKLGRCGVAYVNVSEKAVPTEKRGFIRQVKPSGWQTVKYDFIDGKYLYNQCHLISYQLTDKNANGKNLVTGARYMNTEGMLPFENQIADYVKETGNHVLYRMTPIYEDNNLVAGGVLMEVISVEDRGPDIEFNASVYNVQPDVTVDCKNGESHITK